MVNIRKIVGADLGALFSSLPALGPIRVFLPFNGDWAPWKYQQEIKINRKPHEKEI